MLRYHHDNVLIPIPRLLRCLLAGRPVFFHTSVRRQAHKGDLGDHQTRHDAVDDVVGEITATQYLFPNYAVTIANPYYFFSVPRM